MNTLACKIFAHMSYHFLYKVPTYNQNMLHIMWILHQRESQSELLNDWFLNLYIY